MFDYERTLSNETNHLPVIDLKSQVQRGQLLKVPRQKKQGI